MILKQCAQQIGLSASANASDNLDLTVPLIGEQLVKISVSFDFHKAFLYAENFRP